MDVEKRVSRLEGASHRVKHLPGQKAYGTHPALFFGAGHDLVVRGRKNISLALRLLFGFKWRGTRSVAMSSKNREPEGQRQRKNSRKYFHNRHPIRRWKGTRTRRKVSNEHRLRTRHAAV